jgi:NDP-sugar pyrophosphorylase family protein
LTLTRPKHLLPIANRPHIEHVFELLLRHGISEAALLTSYLADAFSDVIARASGAGMTIETTFEEQPLGTAGAFKNAQGLIGDDTFVAFNGDILTDLDLTSVLDWHRAKQAEATIVLHAVEDPSAFGVVPTDDDGRVEGFIEKPPPGEAPTNLINAGVYVFEPSILERIPAGEVWSAERQLFPQLVEEEARLFALGTDAYWMDIGTPEKYLQANLDALSGAYHLPDLALHDAATLIGRDVEIARTASVKTSCLGPRCVVGGDAVVEDAVLLDGVTVESGANVVRSVLGAGVVVREGVRLEGAALADGEVAGAEGTS